MSHSHFIWVQNELKKLDYMAGYQMVVSGMAAGQQDVLYFNVCGSLYVTMLLPVKPFYLCLSPLRFSRLWLIITSTRRLWFGVVHGFSDLWLINSTMFVFKRSQIFTRVMFYVIKWKHFPRYWPFVRGIHRSPVNSPDKCQWRGALMFSWICAWINYWVNNREAGDLRRHRAHYDVTVKLLSPFSACQFQYPSGFRFRFRKWLPFCYPVWKRI